MKFALLECNVNLTKENFTTKLLLLTFEDPYLLTPRHVLAIVTCVKQGFTVEGMPGFKGQEEQHRDFIMGYWVNGTSGGNLLLSSNLDPYITRMISNENP